MALAGTLEVQMLANLARLSDDMGKAQRTVGSAMAGIEKSVASAKAALGALGIGISAIGFVTLIKGSIDAMDKLRDLSKTTNIAVESLAGLQLAARQSGGDLNSIADSINKLSQNMGKDADKFRQLGITAKEPLEAFKQLADIYTRLEDPQQRAAVMAQALGKSWAGAAPLLSEGSAKIQEMVDKGIRLSGVTKEMADAADEFNDQMVELNTTLGSITTRTVGPMLPAFNAMAEAINKSAQEGNILLGILKEIIKLDVALMSTLGLPVDALAEKLFKGTGEGAILTPKAAGAGSSKAAADAAAVFLGGDKESGGSLIARQLQEAAEIEAKEMAEAAQLSDDFRRREREQEQAHIDLRNQILIEAYDREQADAIRQGEELLAIDKAIQDQKKMQQLVEIQGANSFMNNMAGLMNTQSKKVFEIGKKAAIAQAAYKGGLAVMDAWEAGMSTGGPLAPVIAAAYAAAAAAYSLNLINNIRNQEFGGGGGVPISPTQGASNISPVGAGGAAPSSTGQTTIINLPAQSLFTRDQVQELLELENESRADGSQTIIR